MKQITILFAILLVMFFAVGCTDQNGPAMATMDDAPNGDALSKISNAPGTSGPFVVRGQTTFAVFYVDTKAGVSAIHGTDIIQFCQSGAPFDLVDLMSVSVPEDPNRLNQLMQGTVQTSVWPFTVFDCNAFLNTAPLGTGTANLINTDNDLLVFLNPNNVNANAFGFTAQGQLTRPDGSTAQFNGVNKSVWDGVDISTLKTTVKINLN